MDFDEIAPKCEWRSVIGTCLIKGINTECNEKSCGMMVWAKAMIRELEYRLGKGGV